MIAIVFVAASCGSEPVELTESEPTATSPQSRPTGLPAGRSGSVTRFVDGDSLEVISQGRLIEVRLIGINAPELGDCQGPAARDALAQMIGDSGIVLVGEEEDRYGRLLADVVAGSVDVNAEMVRNGWALAIHGSGDRHLAAAVAASNSSAGLWNPASGDCEPVDAAMKIVSAVVDPPGPDDDNLESELVVLVNEGSAAVDIGGWLLRDESTSNRLVLPRLIVEPGAELTVRTGCGTDSPTEIHWCSDGAVWSNGGDTVLLLGPGGSYVDHLFVD